MKLLRGGLLIVFYLAPLAGAHADWRDLLKSLPGGSPTPTTPARVGAGLRNRLGDRIEHGHSVRLLTALPWHDAGDNPRAVPDHLFRVE